MRQSFLLLRLTLLVVVMANLALAYVFFFQPELLANTFQLEILDEVHQYFAMTVGSLLMVFALGALFPLVRPLKYGSIIIMLLLMNFSIFITDVVLLARGGLSFTILIPEMMYFLVVSTALVRYYPIRAKEPKLQPEVIAEEGVSEPTV